MNNRYDCTIILDLLPLLVEKMVREETEQVIRQHMEECEECRQIYEEMTREIDIIPESGKRKKKRKHNYRKKSKVRILISGYLLLLLLIMVFCLVDITFF